MDGHLIRELYSEEFIDKLKHKYREIAEIMNSTKLGGFEMMEFLMSYKGEFSLEKFHQYILNLPLIDYVYHFFGYEISKEEIERALNEEEYLSRLYGEKRFHIKSFIYLKQIIYHREAFLNGYFECIQAIRTPELESYLDQCEKQVEGLKEKVEKDLEVMTPSQFGGEVLNSICCSSKENGKNLARHLMLTPSTVSHHMEQLIACGLVEEERCGNTKLYSINQRKVQEFMEQLRGILLKNY